MKTMKNQIVEFYNDPDFQRLNSYYNRTTIFNILNIERRELSHSAFLKWLFDINSSHNLNAEPLKKLLRHIANANVNEKISENIINALLTGDYKIKDFNIETEKSVVVGKNMGRIDIFLEFCMNKDEKENKVFVIIENKIDSKHHDDQTITYKKWADSNNKDGVNFLIYLSPNPADEEDEISDYIMTSYQDILEYVIEPLLNMEMNVDTKIILEDYIVNLGQSKRQVDEDGKENDLETILAVSKKNKETFSKLLCNYERLLKASLVAKYGTSNLLKDYFKDDLNSIVSFIEANKLKSLLSSF